MAAYCGLKLLPIFSPRKLGCANLMPTPRASISCSIRSGSRLSQTPKHRPEMTSNQKFAPVGETMLYTNMYQRLRRLPDVNVRGGALLCPDSYFATVALS